MGGIIGLIIFGIPSAIIANSKGFKPLRWLIALGLIGLIVVATLASAKAPDIADEEREQRAAKADNLGAVFALISVGLTVLLSIVGLAMMAANS
jgi:hypothetical protein